MRKFLTIFTLSLLAVSCIDNDYDLSDIDTDDIGIGDENSVFTCPLMTLRVAVADIVNEQGDLDGILAEADVWLPNRLPDGAEAVDVKHSAFYSQRSIRAIITPNFTYICRVNPANVWTEN